ncbi:MAG: LysR family transcriptional regulator [Edaphobacter sp.]|uniref:helix-turn-helix domain-containing protein n=1 Tax=Edaphobacter sp. TaxID=1934404 RepID=UPI002397F27B|nr:LysR family transcriptional regulator [Edaphobacter sp.]MDE1177130.1 LysR family transcriptional regulator [Edaphobacter sp.]
MSDIIEFRHLEYLVAIAESKNFSKAAEHVLRSQPAVSPGFTRSMNLLIRWG